MAPSFPSASRTTSFSSAQHIRTSGIYSGWWCWCCLVMMFGVPEASASSPRVSPTANGMSVHVDAAQPKAVRVARRRLDYFASTAACVEGQQGVLISLTPPSTPSPPSPLDRKDVPRSTASAASSFAAFNAKASSKAKAAPESKAESPSPPQPTSMHRVDAFAQRLLQLGSVVGGESADARGSDGGGGGRRLGGEDRNTVTIIHVFKARAFCLPSLPLARMLPCLVRSHC